MAYFILGGMGGWKAAGSALGHQILGEVSGRVFSVWVSGRLPSPQKGSPMLC